MSWAKRPIAIEGATGTHRLRMHRTAAAALRAIFCCSADVSGTKRTNCPGRKSCVMRANSGSSAAARPFRTEIEMNTSRWAARSAPPESHRPLPPYKRDPDNEPPKLRPAAEVAHSANPMAQTHCASSKCSAGRDQCLIAPYPLQSPQNSSSLDYSLPGESERRDFPGAHIEAVGRQRAILHVALRAGGGAPSTRSTLRKM